jgi:hypothetical protein
VADIQVMLHRRKHVSGMQKEHRPVEMQGANYDATGHKDETDIAREAHPYYIDCQGLIHWHNYKVEVQCEQVTSLWLIVCFGRPGQADGII